MTKTVNLSGEAKLNIFGDVAAVLDGVVDPKNVPQLDLKTVPYGLGAGRYEDPTFFGETLVLNHIAWGTTVAQSGDVDTQKVKKTLETPFLLGIDIQKEPASLAVYNNLAAIEVFEDLAKQFTLGFAFLADAQFAVFEGAYLKRSPIYGENVNDNKQAYWAFPGAQLDVQAFLFGVILTSQGQQTLPHIEKAFYHNPNESKPLPFSLHVHAALCEDHPLPHTFAEMQNLFLQTPLLGIRHFLTQSLIKTASFALFALS